MAEEVHIIDLIEHYPITALSSTSNIKLLEKIQYSFTEAEQRLFVTSFFCYLNYNTTTEFVVDLDKIWRWLGFNQKYNAERMLEKHFKIDVDYAHSSMLTTSTKSDDEKWGGHNIKKIMLTVRCFKSLCLKAQTAKASEIHEYYMKLEDIMHEVIKEEGAELKRVVEEHKNLLEQKTQELKRTPEQENHNTLLRKYGTIRGALIYIVRIKECDHGKYIIKIGESRKGIRNRFTEFKKKYGSQVLILDCFLVQNSAGLEKFLHSHSEIHHAKVTDLPGHEMENELFLIGDSLTYQRVLDIIEANLPKFNEISTEYEQLKTENELLRTQLTAVQSTETNPVACIPYDRQLLQEILLINRQLLQKVQTLESSNQDIQMRLNALQTKTTTACSLPDPHLGPRLQKIHPETLELIHVYESVTECMKEDLSIKRPSLNKAVRENTIYHGFRWLLVDRTMSASHIHEIKPTKEIRKQKNGYIAKLNQERTKIMAIYLDRKTAAQQNQYSSISSLDNAVKHHTLKDGYYYQLYEECDSDLKSKVDNTHGEVVLYHDGVGQFSKDNKLIKEFQSRFDCTTRTGMSQKSLAKVLNQPLMYKEHYYKTLGTKLAIYL